MIQKITVKNSSIIWRQSKGEIYHEIIILLKKAEIPIKDKFIYYGFYLKKQMPNTLYRDFF